MTSAKISARGSWPGPLTLRSGWWKGVCRRLNDDMDDVSLRIERGSAEFVERCTAWAFEQGTPAVWSPPLASQAAGIWTQAGFAPHRQLALMERSLDRSPGSIDTVSRRGRDEDWPAAAIIDGLAFEGSWRMGSIGLRDAMAATPQSEFMVAEVDGSVLGFAVVGAALHTGYLQRIAVDPAHQGRGIGRALLRQSMAWARRAGARSMLLNTQLDNDRAAVLYQSEGFIRLPDRLTLYRRPMRGDP